MIIGLVIVGIVTGYLGIRLIWSTTLRGIKEEFRAWKIRRKYKPDPVANVYQIVASDRSTN
jgi:hypothetical protein